MNCAMKGAIGIVLIKQMDSPFPFDQAIGIVEPVGGRRKMIARTMGIGGKRHSVWQSRRQAGTLHKSPFVFMSKLQQLMLGDSHSGAWLSRLWWMMSWLHRLCSFNL